MTLSSLKTLFPSPISVVHTAPHHDDIMLAYFPLLADFKRHHQQVLCVTSGTNGVSDTFVQKGAPLLISRQRATALCKPIRVAREQAPLPGSEGQCPSLSLLALKQQIREAEENQFWTSVGLPLERVTHFRAQFYTQPELVETDIQRMAAYFKEANPDLVTVAFDRVGLGPATHHKVLRVIVAALSRITRKASLKIWGYRNVWSRFSLTEATYNFPVYSPIFEEQHTLFLSCYPSQVEAFFPSPTHKGPFSEQAMQIQREQADELRPEIGADVRGVIRIREMTLPELLAEASS